MAAERDRLVRLLRHLAMNTADVARTSVVICLALLVQHAVLDWVQLGGAHADLMILLPIAAGYVAGPERGAIVGFASGLVADLLLPTTFGLSALVGCIIGFATGTATAGLVRSSAWLPPVVFAAATAASLVAYAILGAVLGEPNLVSAELPAALVVATPAAAVLAIPVVRIVAWAVPPPAPDAAGASGGHL